MKSQDYPARHLEQMARLSALLGSLPAQVLEHSYSYESFGSWTIVLPHKGVRKRIVFDGRDSRYRIQQSSARKPPDEWGETIWERACDPGGDIPLSEIVEAITKPRASG